MVSIHHASNFHFADVCSPLESSFRHCKYPRLRRTARLHCSKLTCVRCRGPQAKHKSSFQGATVQRPAATAVAAAAAAGSPSATPTAKRALPDLRKTESVPDVLAATLVRARSGRRRPNMDAPS